MPSATEPVLKFRQVTKRFGANTVLDEFDLTLRSGEKVALIGPSGSGKSTVLRIAMTLEDVNAGDVLAGSPLSQGITALRYDGASQTRREPGATSLVIM